METSGWVSVGIAFVILEGTIFAAWMSLRDRVTKNEAATTGLKNVIETRINNLEKSVDSVTEDEKETREKVGKLDKTQGVHEQRHKSAESRLRRLDGLDVPRNLAEGT